MVAFDQAFAITMVYEGSEYDRTSSDAGNWTGGAVGSGELRGSKFGISAAAFPALDIESLTLDAARAIYRPRYWDKIAGDAMPLPLACLAFDAAVNNGPANAARWLQLVAGVAADGIIGPETMSGLAATIGRRGIAAVCGQFQAQRLWFMSRLSTWSDFGHDWSDRLADISVRVGAMIPAAVGAPAA